MIIAEDGIDDSDTAWSYEGVWIYLSITIDIPLLITSVPGQQIIILQVKDFIFFSTAITLRGRAIRQTVLATVDKNQFHNDAFSFISNPCSVYSNMQLLYIVM